MLDKRCVNTKPDSIAQMAMYLYLFNALCKYFLPSTLTKILPVLSVFLLMMTTKNLQKIKINKIDKPYIIFLFVFGMGCLYSPAPGKGLGYVFSFAVAFLFGIYGCMRNFNENRIIWFLTISCLIMAGFVILQPLMPELVSRIDSTFHYSSEDYALMKAWTRNGWYTGLFPNRAPAAFYSCILVGTGLYFFYNNYKSQIRLFKRFFGVIFAFIGVYTILLTAKRGLLLGAVIAAFITFVVYKKSNQAPVWKICVGVIVVVTLGIIVFLNFEATKVMLMRFFNSDDILTGRGAIYSNILSNIEKSPIIGTGTASAVDLLGVAGHNIYLTVFMENGLISVGIFVFALAYTLYKTIKDSLKYGKNNYKQALPFLMFSLYIQLFFAVYGMSGNPLYDNYILYFYLFAVLILKNIEYRFSILNYGGRSE